MNGESRDTTVHQTTEGQTVAVLADDSVGKAQVRNGARIPAQSSSTADLPTLEFVGPVAGFPEHRSFVLAEIDPASMVRSLRSLEDPDVRFLVIPPGPFFPDYVPELSDEWAEALGLTGAAEALVLVIVNPGAALADATVNLLAPVVINTGTRRAAQVVLADPALPMRAPLGIG